MKLKALRTTSLLALAGLLWLGGGSVGPSSEGWMASAAARVGRPLTPVSYAGVARRTTVRVVAVA